MHGPKWLRDFLGSLRTLKRDVASLVHQSAKLQCLSSLFLGNDLFCRCRVGWKVERRVLLPYHLDYHEKSWNVWFMISSASTGKRIQHCSFISGSESKQFTKKDPKNDSFTGPNAMNDSKKTCYDFDKSHLELHFLATQCHPRLPALSEQGHRTLIFSQGVRMMDLVWNSGGLKCLPVLRLGECYINIAILVPDDRSNYMP